MKKKRKKRKNAMIHDRQLFKRLLSIKCKIYEEYQFYKINIYV